MPEERRILIVEDEEGLALHMTLLLQRNHYHPLDAVSTGEEAVEKAGLLHPALVLMDIKLAGKMDGIEAARLIHSQYNIPVIFLTALAEDNTFTEAAGSDPYAFLVKPVKEADLRAAIELALYKHQMEDRLSESEERYRLLFEKMSSGFCLGELICDDAGKPVDYRLLAYNSSFAQMFGLTSENWTGKTLYTLNLGFDPGFMIATFAQVARTSQPVIFEYLVPGVSRYLKITAYSPKGGQFANIIEDITDRRQAEFNLRQNESQLRESFTRLERSLHRMTALRNVDLAITTHIDQSSMAESILAQVVDSAEIDAAVLFVPNVPTPGRPRGTGPLSALRLAGLAGLPESSLDGTVLNWQMLMVNHVFQTCQPLYINDLRQDSHPGAQALYKSAGYLTSAVLPLLTRGQSKGVLQFFHRKVHTSDADWQTFLQSLALQAAIGLDHVEMLENLKRTNRELASAYDETIKGWAQALELRDKEMRGHANRVTDLTVRLAMAIGMSGDALDHIRRGAFLHDIGKMAIPDSILGKTGPLTNDDWITMRQHPTVGYRMLANIEYLKPALDVVYCHHERWDGAGYPRMLKGEEIPLSARIFAVIDVWDALTNDRPYRLAWPEDEVAAYLLKESGKHFDPRVVDAFLKIIAQEHS